MLTRSPEKKITRRLRRSKYEGLTPYLVAQAKHESANFTSPLFKSQKNVWGMKSGSSPNQPGEPGREAPDGGNYRKYNSITEATDGIIFWLDRKNFPVSVPSVTSFVNELKDRHFFTDSKENYINGMQRFLS